MTTLKGRAKPALMLHGMQAFVREEHDDLSFTETVITTVTGTLAVRIRRRLSLPRDAVVTLEEAYWEGGTDYTRESNTTFVVRAGDRTISFHPDRDSRRWDPERPYSESVYARFHHWLESGHRDARCWATWIDEGNREAAGRFVKLPFTTGAPLELLAMEHSRGNRISEAYLWGEQSEGEWKWRVDGVSVNSFPREGLPDFRPLAFHCYLAEGTRTAGTTAADRRTLLCAITDLLAPGHSPA